MRQRGVKILGGPRDAGGEQLCGGIAGPFCQAGLDMAAGRLNFALRKQYGGQEMMQHGIAGLAAQPLLAESACVIGLAGIEGGGSAANDVLGGVLAHVEHIRTKQRVCKEGRSPSNMRSSFRGACSAKMNFLFGGREWQRPPDRR